jgi:antitoxin component YwqK of YwqJK toxin-antitoxin module
MKNGVPHGYGTGYYANGKVGHVGLFKGGKIVQ